MFQLGGRGRHNNSLWQCDLKLVDTRWLITILDYHSRFTNGSERFNEGTAENTILPLERAIHECAKPRDRQITEGNSTA